MTTAIHRRCTCGGETTITLPDPAATERNAAAFDRAHAGCPTRPDGAWLAFIVRDLMDAASYQYDPGRPLAEQARECDQIIRDFREGLVALQAEFAAANTRYDNDRQRLTDLVDELRRQLTGALKLAQRHGARIDLGDDPDGDVEGADYPPFPAGKATP